MARDPSIDAPAHPLTTQSRRTLLRAAAAGTAAAAAWGAAKALGLEETAVSTTLDERPGAAPVLAYVRDASRGEIVVMRGATEIVRRDAQLAARLVAIAKEAGDVIAS